MIIHQLLILIFLP